MNRVVLIVLFVFGFASLASAQQLVITVVEQNSGATLPAMMVKAGSVTGLTDMDGVLSISVASFPVTIEISGTGYETLRQQVHNPGSVRVNVARKMNSLNETVVTGIARPTRLQNALSQYRVITRAENLAQGNITLADALATRLNISVGNDQILGSTTKIQGMSGNKVKILIDGLPVNGREGGNIDLSQINLNNIERIETVQGPMSVVYGSDALGGVINLITRKTNKKWEANGGFNYESVGKYNFDVAASRTWGKHQVSVGGGRNYFRGWKDLDTGTSIPHRRLQWKPKEQYLGNIAYTYTARSGFKAQLASDYTREKIINKGVAQVDAFRAYAFDEYYRTNRLNNRLILENKIGKNGHWESRNGYALYYRTKQRVVRDLVSFNEVPTAGTGDQDTSRYDDVNLRSNYSNIVGKLKYDVGYDVLLQLGKSGKIPGNGKFLGDYALYQNISMDFLKNKLTLQASIREAYNTQYPAPLVYSFQALFTPVKKVQIRGSFAKGFRAPSLKEQYLDFIDQNHMIYGNPNLKAETGNHAQASISYQPYEKDGNYVQIIATGLFNDVTNQIALSRRNPNDSLSLEYIYSNFSNFKNAIFNLQLEQQWKDFHLVLEYSNARQFGQDGLYSAFSASEYTARANYYWKWSGLTFNVFFKRTGKQANVTEGIDGLAVYSGEISGYNRMDASLERKFWKNRIQLIAGVKNIFDVQTIGGTAAASSGGHSVAMGSFLPRTAFTTLRLNLN